MYFLIRNNILMLNSGKLYKENYHIINAKLNDEIKIKKTSNSYIEGQSFEKTDEVKHSPIKYIVESSKTKEILEEYESTDGSFKIENLQDNENINLIVLDLSKKYNGKYIENISVQLDYNKSMKIIRIYQTTITAHSASYLEKNFNYWADKENVTVISTSLVIKDGYHLSVVYTEN